VVALVPGQLDVHTRHTFTTCLPNSPPGHMAAAHPVIRTLFIQCPALGTASFFFFFFFFFFGLQGKLLAIEKKQAWHIDDEQLSCLLLALLGTSLYFFFFFFFWVQGNCPPSSLRYTCDLDSYVGLIQIKLMLCLLKMNRLGYRPVNKCLVGCLFCLTCGLFVDLQFCLYPSSEGGLQLRLWMAFRFTLVVSFVACTCMCNE